MRDAHRLVPAMDRRRWLAMLAAIGTAPLSGLSWAGASASRFVAAWEAEHGYRVGVLARTAQGLAVQSALDVPTRAHGLWVERGGTLLAAARRPGDWLVRWRPDGTAVTWCWIEPGRAFNGHVIASADGRHLYTTETDLETASGLIGVRDAASLEKIDEWSTHGMDPHELLTDTDGSLVVANGGIPTLPETGRVKVHLDRMDASLVRLDTADGRLRGQWRLPDPRLSLRHMAWGERGQLGIALQAEHDRTEDKAAAPLFATFDGQALRAHAAEHALVGYGGDIAFANGRYAVSCPRAHGVAMWRADGRWDGFTALAEACALTSAERGGIWAGGRERALRIATAAGAEGDAAPLASLRLDNHWAELG
ncbi:DUF1513 domain-containing protein [Variovorax guangxiensis]|uniref:DUF1513 domain-containing protein n=1 Tax=Variovorax guangxiensis TaxID=1775474 RepID=A0A502DV83_9BURK|nr:DUF1513 domain-containing protein [Variovorax guangxiensis]RZI65975.1 MAG: DUF1513 domain-containing protein [Variovorax sp.]TPG24259.1 DUF1513 domain-containing protein [Variovorax ginsengisoli]TPG28509.1 DUF1513 domain-containing protein [Variovorax guangxiensis]